MSHRTLNRRLVAIERRLAFATSNCPACAARGGIRFIMPGDKPPPLAPCTQCGRVREPMTFRITLATPPTTAPAA